MAVQLLSHNEKACRAAASYSSLNEPHRAAAVQRSIGAGRLLEAFPQAKLRGLSDTGIRQLDLNRDVGQELFGENQTAMILGEAIVRGILSAPIYVTARLQGQSVPARYAQHIGRVVTAGTGGTLLILDAVNNFDGHTAVDSLRQKITFAVRRPYQKGGGDGIVLVRFRILEQVQDCRRLFERLGSGLNSGWETCFAATSTYAAKHGNLKIRQNSKTETGRSLSVWRIAQRAPHDDVAGDGTPLGKWMIRARAMCANRKQQIHLTEEGISQPDELDMVWRIIGLNDLCAMEYCQEHGGLQVPAAGRMQDGFILGSWVRKQRYTRERGKLCKERIVRPEDLGMIGSGYFDPHWTLYNKEAARYFAENRQLEAPQYCCTDSGIALSRWLCERKSRKIRGAISLTKKRIPLPEALQTDWHGQNLWEPRLECLKDCRRRYGDVDVPPGYRAEKSIRLGKWLYVQRTQLNDGTMSAKHREKRLPLGSGIARSHEQNLRYKCHERARQYSERHGNLRMSA